MGRLYHVVEKKVWESAKKNGEYRPESLTLEGFIHLSKQEQVTGVLERYYRGKSGLLLLEIEISKLVSPLKYENTTGGNELFPHLYGPLNLEAVVRAEPVHAENAPA